MEWAAAPRDSIALLRRVCHSVQLIVVWLCHFLGDQRHNQRSAVLFYALGHTVRSGGPLLRIRTISCRCSDARRHFLWRHQRACHHCQRPVHPADPVAPASDTQRHLSDSVRRREWLHHIWSPVSDGPTFAFWLARRKAVCSTRLRYDRKPQSGLRPHPRGAADSQIKIQVVPGKPKGMNTIRSVLTNDCLWEIDNQMGFLNPPLRALWTTLG